MKKIVTNILKQLSYTRRLSECRVFEKIKSFDATTFSVLAMGKVAAHQTKELLNYVKDDSLINDVLVITKYGHREKSLDYIKKVKQFESSHPYYDENSFKAGDLVYDFLISRNKNELLIVLLSGGASALVCNPHQGMSHSDLVREEKDLVDGGLSILDLNLKRNNHSRLKKGGVSYFSNTKNILSIITSDVPSNDLRIIGGGPTYPYGDEEIIKGVLGKKNEHIIVQDFNQLMEISEKVFRKLGCKNILVNYTPYQMYLADLENDLIKKLKKIIKKESTFTYLFGGELTINLPEAIRDVAFGGRSSHFVLKMAYNLFILNRLNLPIDKLEKMTLFSLATDGTDGPTDSSGAYITGKEFLSYGFDEIEDALFYHTSYDFFKKKNRLLFLNKTNNNLMDLYGVIIN